MQEKEKPMQVQVMLNLPENKYDGISLKQIILAIIAEWKKILFITLAFFFVGLLLAVGYRAMKSEVSVGGVATAVIEMKYKGVEKGALLKVKQFDPSELIDSALVEDAMEKSGLTMPLKDVVRGLSITEIIPLDSAKRISLYQQAPATNYVWLQDIANEIYYPTQFTVSLEISDSSVVQQAQINNFLSALVDADENYLIEKYDSYLLGGYNGIPYQSVSDLMSSLEKGVDGQDYPYAANDIKASIEIIANSFYEVPSGENIPQKWNELAKESDLLLENIVRQKATKDLGELLLKAQYLYDSTNIAYQQSSEEARILAEVISSHRLNPNGNVKTNDYYNIPYLMNVNNLSVQAGEAVDSAIGHFNRMKFNEHILKVYENSDENNNENIERDIKELLDKTKALAELSLENKQFFMFELVKAPEFNKSADISVSKRLLLIVAGMTFLGLFVSVCLVFGKRILAD